MKKIAFFDIDGTLTSEIDGSLPKSAINAIRHARTFGHLMFINTGRCFQNVEPRFRRIGFDGYVCGCGTNIFCSGTEALHVAQTHSITMQLLKTARKTNVDILFESRKEVAFDKSRSLSHPDAIHQYKAFLNRGYDMPENLENPNFFCDKFVVWYQTPDQLEEFQESQRSLFYLHRPRRYLPRICSNRLRKATGIQYVLDYYHLDLDAAYAIGDSNNDLPMLSYVPNSVAREMLPGFPVCQ